MFADYILSAEEEDASSGMMFLSESEEELDELSCYEHSHLTLEGFKKIISKMNRLISYDSDSDFDNDRHNEPPLRNIITEESQEEFDKFSCYDIGPLTLEGFRKKISRMSRLISLDSDSENDGDEEPTTADNLSLEIENFRGREKLLELKEKLAVDEMKRSKLIPFNIDSIDDLELVRLNEKTTNGIDENESGMKENNLEKKLDVRLVEMHQQIKTRDFNLLNMESKMKEMEREMMGLKDIITSKEKLISSMNDAMRVMDKGHKKETEELKNELKKAQHTLFDMDKCLVNTQKNWSNEKEFLENEVKYYKERIDILEETLERRDARSTTDILNLEIAQMALQNSLDEKDQELNMKTLEINILKTNLETTDDEVTQGLEKLLDMKQKVSKIEKEKDEILRESEYEKVMISSLTNQIEGIDAKSRIDYEKIANLNEEILILKSVNKELNADHEKSQEENRRLNNVIVELHKSSEDRRILLEMKSEEMVRLQSDYSEQFCTLQSEMKIREKQAEDKEEENLVLKFTLNDCQAHLKTKDDRILQELNNVRELEGRIQETKSICDTKQYEIERLLENLGVCEAKSRADEEMILCLREQGHHLQNGNAELSSDLNKSQEGNKDLVRNLTDLQKSSEELRHTLEMKINEMERLNSDCSENYMRQLGKLESELKAKEILVQDQVQENVALRSSLNGCQAELKRKGDQILEQQENILKLEVRLRHATSDFEAQVVQIDNLQGNLRMSEDLIQNLQAKIVTNSDDIFAMEERRTLLESELSALNVDLTKKSAQVCHLELENNDLRRSVLNYRTNFLSQVQQIDAQQEELEHLKLLVAELKMCLEHSNCQLSQNNVELELAKREIFRRNNEIQNLLSKTTELKGDLEFQELETKRAEVLVRKWHVQALRQQSRKRELKEEIAENELELIRLSNDEHDNNREKVKALQKEVIRLVDKMDEREKHCANLSREIELMVEERDEIQLKLSELLRENFSFLDEEESSQEIVLPEE